ncbi:porin [Shimia marina]|uniref:Porin n=2 Tax=Shimia marina TaxID=321267 RepID=A0A0P1EL93_9RHOB|nr:porin [Shimia marina]CUH51059.1 Porin [Shimia marina]SFD59147.1 outer membrane protein OmpU [Shimia marina]
MKKILIATTALAATASMAAAEVNFGGYARFGLLYNEGAAEETRIEQRFRLNISASTETDGGVEFGGRIRIETEDNADGTARGEGPGSAEFNVSTGGFRLDVGNTSDALDSGDVVDFYGYGLGLTAFLEHDASFDSGFTADGFGAHDGNAQQRVKARYNIENFTVNASYAPEVDGGADEVAQIGLGYAIGDHNVGVVYGDNQTTENDFWVVGVNGSFADFSYSVIVGEGEDDSADTSWGLSGAYAVSAATEIRALVTGGGLADNEAYGIGFRHSLGGGVSLRGGVGQDTAEDTVGDLGVIFSF